MPATRRCRRGERYGPQGARPRFGAPGPEQVGVAAIELSSRLAGTSHRWQSGTVGRTGVRAARSEERGSHETPEDVLARDRPADRRRRPGTRRGRARGRRGAELLGTTAGPLPGGYKNLVVIYEENHSFDNLYGSWGRVGGQRGRRPARTPAATHDPGRPGRHAVRLPAAERRQPHLARRWPTTCTDPAHGVPASHFAQPTRSPSTTTSSPTDTTCPAPGVFAPNGVLKDTGRLPGGCTRDLVHRFYQEQYQIDGGKQDRYVTGSDAVGLTMGHYDTTAAADLPVPAQQGRAATTSSPTTSSRRAFGGSFLNHQYLIAARAPARHQRRRRRRRDELGARQQRDAEHATRSTQPTGPVVRRPADPGLRRRRGRRLRRGLRRHRGQHGPAVEPAVRRRREDPAHRRRRRTPTSATG